MINESIDGTKNNARIIVKIISKAGIKLHIRTVAHNIKRMSIPKTAKRLCLNSPIVIRALFL